VPGEAPETRWWSGRRWAQKRSSAVAKDGVPLQGISEDRGDCTSSGCSFAFSKPATGYCTSDTTLQDVHTSSFIMLDDGCGVSRRSRNSERFGHAIRKRVAGSGKKRLFSALRLVNLCSTQAVLLVFYSSFCFRDAVCHVFLCSHCTDLLCFFFVTFCISTTTHSLCLYLHFLTPSLSIFRRKAHISAPFQSPLARILGSTN